MQIRRTYSLIPQFVYAIPKDSGGFEMMYSEIHQHRISFTSLEAFKVLVGTVKL